jgi:hypothetical protein
MRLMVFNPWGQRLMLIHTTVLLPGLSELDDRPNALDKMAIGRSIRCIHQGSPGKGLRYCWLSRRSDPLNLIQFILA